MIVMRYMVDLALFSPCCRALRPGTRLVLVGMRTSCLRGAGNVFSDLIRSGRVETVFLGRCSATGGAVGHPQRPR